MNYKLKIKICRIKKGMKQKDLAKRLHISTSYMSQLENNTFDIRFGLLLEIANILKVEVDDLYEKIE